MKRTVCEMCRFSPVPQPHSYICNGFYPHPTHLYIFIYRRYPFLTQSSSSILKPTLGVRVEPHGRHLCPQAAQMLRQFHGVSPPVCPCPPRSIPLRALPVPPPPTEQPAHPLSATQRRMKRARGSGNEITTCQLNQARFMQQFPSLVWVPTHTARKGGPEPLNNPLPRPCHIRRT